MKDTQLASVVEELKQFKFSLVGPKAVERLRRQNCIVGVFTFSFDEMSERSLAFQFSSVLFHHANKKDGDVAGTLGELLANYLLLKEGKKTKGFCISRLDEPLKSFLLENIDNLLEAVEYGIYGNPELDEKIPEGAMKQAREAAEKAYLHSLEKNWLVKCDPGISS